MVDNRFEAHVEQTKLARAAEATRIEEQRELEAQAARERDTELAKIALLNQEREMRQLGNSPEEVWGPGIAEMMFEFLDYARSWSQGAGKLIRSEPIWGDQGDVRTRGYRIAYTNVKPVARKTSVPESEFPYPYKKLNLELLASSPPHPDVLLCVDGMIRTLNDKHLPIADVTGRVVKVPDVVQWTETQHYSCTEITGGYPGDSTVPTITGHTYQHVVDFQPSTMSPDLGLEYVLNDYANQIHASAWQHRTEPVQYPVHSRTIEATRMGY